MFHVYRFSNPHEGELLLIWYGTGLRFLYFQQITQVMEDVMGLIRYKQVINGLIFYGGGGAIYLKLFQ